jgi:D-glycero-alpha-D-manno-heptose-7-phosphate kinase
MKVRSKAPLRLGLAGGGTDISPYSDEFGGCVLNATINMYAHAFIDDDIAAGTAIFEAKDLGIIEEIDTAQSISIDGKLRLHRAVYKRIMNDYNSGIYLPLKITTWSDVPAGSGLGSSSAVVVSIIEGLRQLLALPLGEYDVAQLAYDIERKDCELAGGKQDQYASAFGGFNFIEFFSDDRVVVNPLRIRKYIINELEASLVLYFTGASRDSANIIEDQVASLKADRETSLEAMHQVKRFAYKLKEHLFKANIDAMAAEFGESWKAKKDTSASVSNPMIDEIEDALMKAGAKSMKVSGAGGGGFIMIFIDPQKRPDIELCLKSFPGEVRKFQFTEGGSYSWTV